MGKRSNDGRYKAGADFDLKAFEAEVDRFLSGASNRAPDERDFYGKVRVKRPPEFKINRLPEYIPISEKKIEITPKQARLGEEQIRAYQRDMMAFVQMMMEAEALQDKKLKQVEQERIQNKFLSMADLEAMIAGQMEMKQAIVKQPMGRVKMDVRLAERQKEEAMSVESKVFKEAMKRKLEESFAKALEATEGFGMLAEDWAILRQSLIEMVAEQSRLYYERSRDNMLNEDHATITFEIPKMVLSFRMPLDERFNR